MSVLESRFIMGFHSRWCALLNSLFPNVTLSGGLRLRVSPSGCKPLHAEYELVDDVRAGELVLDIGTGTGVIAIAAARRGARVVAVDVSPTAVRDCRENARTAGVTSLVEVLEGDCCEGVDGSFDWIVAHPPYVERQVSFHADRQWAATTPSFIEQLVTSAAKLIQPSGRLVILWPKNKEQRIRTVGALAGLELETSSTHRAGSLKLLLLRMAYLDVGFASTKYVLRRTAGPATHSPIHSTHPTTHSTIGAQS